MGISRSLFNILPITYFLQGDTWHFAFQFLRNSGITLFYLEPCSAQITLVSVSSSETYVSIRNNRDFIFICILAKRCFRHAR